MHSVIHTYFKHHESILDDYIKDFDHKGDPFGKQDRNTLKLFKLEEKTINFKSFKTPNLINQIAYRFFRKSKAQRSFEYANKLLELGVGTPQPIGYYEFYALILFKKSFYISEHLDYDLTYRELTSDLNYPNHEAILRAFTRFTFNLHERGIQFLDHSPGNTLIQLNGGNYKFFLVDLNRMKFGKLDFETRIKNFSRLTIYKSMVEIMSDEYAKCTGEDYHKVFDLMWKYTETFQKKFQRKKRLKKKLIFWKH